MYVLSSAKINTSQPVGTRGELKTVQKFNCQQAQGSGFSTASRRAKRSNQPSNQIGIRVIFSGARRPSRESDYLHSPGCKFKNSSYMHMTPCSMKQRKNLFLLRARCLLGYDGLYFCGHCQYFGVILYLYLQGKNPNVDRRPSGKSFFLFTCIHIYIYTRFRRQQYPQSQT